MLELDALGFSGSSLETFAILVYKNVELWTVKSQTTVDQAIDQYIYDRLYCILENINDLINYILTISEDQNRLIFLFNS